MTFKVIKKHIGPVVTLCLSIHWYSSVHVSSTFKYFFCFICFRLYHHNPFHLLVGKLAMLTVRLSKIFHFWLSWQNNETFFRERQSFPICNPNQTHIKCVGLKNGKFSKITTHSTGLVHSTGSLKTNLTVGRLSVTRGLREFHLQKVEK